MTIRKHKVIIYRNHLLRPSETFIRAQTSHLSSFDYCYVGSRRVSGLPLPKEKTLTVNGSTASQKYAELAYRLTGKISSGMYEQLKKRSPQLIHAHFGPDSIRALSLSNKLGVPLVVTFHGYGATIKPSYAWRSSYTQFIYLLNRTKLQRNAAHFIAVSDYIKNLLLNQGFPREKVTTHYIGVDTAQFTQNPRIQRRATVLFVGRLVECKGCEFLVRAMAAVQAALPNTELVVIGDGPLRAQLEKLAAEKLNRYRFLGFQNQSVVREWMNQAKVLCVPSITAKSGHAEAFGIVFAEAQSMGLPVVSCDSGGISEAVEHGKTGFLVPEKDTEALANQMIKLLKDPMLWERFSQSAMQRAREKFDIVQQTQKLERFYLDVILNSRRN